MLPELYLSGLLPLLIFCPSCEVLSSIYRLKSYTEYTSGLLHRVIFYAALHFLIPACIYFDTLFTSFTVLEHRNLCEDKVQYSPFLKKMNAMAVLVLVNRNGTNFDAEYVNCRSNPVVRSYLSFWVRYKLCAWTIAYHYSS